MFRASFMDLFPSHARTKIAVCAYLMQHMGIELQGIIVRFRREHHSIEAEGSCLPCSKMRNIDILDMCP